MVVSASAAGPGAVKAILCAPVRLGDDQEEVFKARSPLRHIVHQAYRAFVTLCFTVWEHAMPGFREVGGISADLYSIHGLSFHCAG